MNIKRFYFWPDHEFRSEASDGEWVRYDDHAKIVADLYDENTQLRMKLAMVDRLYATIEEERKRQSTFILAQEPGFQPFRA